MRTSAFPLNTLKETPADAEIISHQLMLRAGLIRRVAAGIYTWLPLGLRVLRHVQTIVREEMDRAGAIELLMPAVQPGELWEESGRWGKFGPLLLRFKDRHEREFCLGPTHEEIITDFVRNEIRSYKQLPVNYYQIQMKFRDETRPRFGVMRSREFIMKDAYSFHLDAESLDATYHAMYDAYCRIFDRLGLDYRAVIADSGSIGGSRSQEFHVLAESGEDDIAYVEDADYAANTEMAPTFAPLGERPDPSEEMEKFATPGIKTIQDLADFLNIGTDQTVKTLIVEGEGEGELVCLCLRGDHKLNEIKTEKLDGVKSPLTMASEAAVTAKLGAGFGSLGPVGVDMPIIADFALMNMADMIVGANETEQHYRGVNWGRDCPEPRFHDIRNVEAGDPAPDNLGTFKIARGIEVGHIFQLGDVYSQAMNCSVLDENGKNVVLQMGCYGIGVTRIVGAAIEQNHDGKGIIWPDSMTPFQVAICPMNGHKSMRLMEVANQLHDELESRGISVLLDDRPVRPGVMFSDMELIGIPHRITLGERGLDNGEVEYRHRRDSDNTMIPQDDILTFIVDKLASLSHQPQTSD